jgi:hypothetical protein
VPGVSTVASNAADRDAEVLRSTRNPVVEVSDIRATDCNRLSSSGIANVKWRIVGSDASAERSPSNEYENSTLPCAVRPSMRYGPLRDGSTGRVLAENAGSRSNRLDVALPHTTRLFRIAGDCTNDSVGCSPNPARAGLRRCAIAAFAVDWR